MAERKRRAQQRHPEDQQSFEAVPRERHFANDFVLFFPEGLFAVLTLLAAPFLALNQLSLGHYAAALKLVVASAAGIAIAAFAWRQRSKWLLYAGVLVVLAGGYLAIAVPATQR